MPNDSYQSDAAQWRDMDHTEAGVWGLDSTRNRGRDRELIDDLTAPRPKPTPGQLEHAVAIALHYLNRYAERVGDAGLDAAHEVVLARRELREVVR